MNFYLVAIANFFAFLTSIGRSARKPRRGFACIQAHSKPEKRLGESDESLAGPLWIAIADCGSLLGAARVEQLEADKLISWKRKTKGKWRTRN